MIITELYRIPLFALRILLDFHACFFAKISPFFYSLLDLITWLCTWTLMTKLVDCQHLQIGWWVIACELFGTSNKKEFKSKQYRQVMAHGPLHRTNILFSFSRLCFLRISQRPELLQANLETIVQKPSITVNELYFSFRLSSYCFRNKMTRMFYSL
jgi:hypothetical protein